MGTNFYWISDPCKTCEHYEVYHIGKNSGGFYFLFRGHLEEDFCVRSYDDWLKVFEKGGKIEDEYGNEWQLEKSLRLVWNADEFEEENLKSHYDTLKEEGFALFTDPKEWKDRHGFSFSNVEFC